MAESLLAVVRIKGSAKTTADLERTFARMKLNTINSCVVIPADGPHRGMLQKINGYATWGEVSKEMLERLIEKRGEGDSKKAKEKAAKAIKDGSMKDMFRLSPPSGGFRSVKLPYPKGDVGYRGEKINALLGRMI